MWINEPVDMEDDLLAVPELHRTLYGCRVRATTRGTDAFVHWVCDKDHIEYRGAVAVRNIHCPEGGTRDSRFTQNDYEPPAEKDTPGVILAVAPI